MAKLILSNLANLQNEATATATINANNSLISTAMENTLSRDGTTPNTMGSNLDMNSHRITNLPEPVSNTEPLRLGDVEVATITQMEAIRDAAIAAQNAAEDAQEAAETAQTAAETAETNAETAETNAETAETNAEAAQAAAETAQGLAETAQTAAEAAQTAAEAAQSAAETAQSNAETSASNAATSEANAATSESNAQTAETNAEAAQAAAEAAQAAAEAAADNFDDVYLGSKASDPTVDNDGNPLIEGQLYWNSSSNNLRIYDGSAWQAYSAASGLTELSDDTTPQLGGNLDLNGHIIEGLEIGVDVEAYDATILKDADVGTSGDKLPKLNAENTWSAQQSSSIATLTDATNIAWDVSTKQKAKVTITDNRTMNAVTNAVEGTSYFLWIIQDGTGSRTITWTTSGAGSFDFGTEGQPTLTTTADKADLLCFEAISIGGTLKLRFVGIKKGFA
jgi:hypothetical protein